MDVQGTVLSQIHLPLPNDIRPNMSSIKEIQHLLEEGSVKKPWKIVLYVLNQNLFKKWTSYMLHDFLNVPCRVYCVSSRC